mmetsp:Transcript_21998/g.62479  ORF Transcript_21998/g.62479 Transcript_21998/m.62479 type:complete len:412 (+) Transcript_21998:78-1313(+)
MASRILVRSRVEADLRLLFGLGQLPQCWKHVGTGPEYSRHRWHQRSLSEYLASARRSCDDLKRRSPGQWQLASAALVAAAAMIGPPLTRCDSSTGESTVSGAAKADAPLRMWYSADAAQNVEVGSNQSTDQTHADLVYAIRMDKVRTAFNLLRALRTGIDAPITEQKETALAVACRFGSLQVMSALLRFGANPSMREEQGASCVALACSEGHLEVVRRLVQDVRTDLGCYDAHGYALVHRAVACGHLDIVHYLLSMKGGQGRENMLTIEATAPAEMGAAQSNLESPLHVALRRLSRPLKNPGFKAKRHEMLELLLDFGADPTLQDRHGDTPMHLCARANDLGGLWILLLEVPDIGAATQMVNHDGKSVLEEADAYGMRTRLTVGMGRFLPRPIRRQVASFMFSELLMISTM